MTRCAMSRWPAFILAMLAAAAVSAQQTQPQTEKPQAPETAPAKPPSGAPIPGVAMIGPAREIKLAPDTWFRFGAQVQAWAQAHQDRLTTGADGSYGYDFFCRRCRFFATGSVVKNVFFNILFEAAPGKADPVTGAKAASTPQVLDAYGQVKLADWFWLSAGNILMPLTRNGTQPTTTYLSLDNANIDTTPILQGNSYVLRDLGFQANGFFMANHLEYRLGVFQGSRQPARISGTGATAVTQETAGHNPPRFVGMLSLNFWDTETGYVNGGHYYGTKKVFGVMVNADYQAFRKDGPALPVPGTTANNTAATGADKNAYYGLSGAVFLNYPLSGSGNPKGGDELAATVQVGYYDGGFAMSSAGAVTNAGTYPNVLKQLNYLAEAAYYNASGKFSVFGKYEARKISDDYPTALKAASNQTWIAGGVKYYLAPANLMNLALQYERINNNDAPSTQQGGTNNLTLAWQTLLY